jgi:hypothetical protein
MARVEEKMVHFVQVSEDVYVLAGGEDRCAGKTQRRGILRNGQGHWKDKLNPGYVEWSG